MVAIWLILSYWISPWINLGPSGKYIYQAARHVITFRIHSTLSCFAFNTPVLHLIKPGFESSRFAGVVDLAHHMTIDDFLKNNWDINNPPENPRDYLPIRENLEKYVQSIQVIVVTEAF